jgi:hypothetical protein
MGVAHCGIDVGIGHFRLEIALTDMAINGRFGA